MEDKYKHFFIVFFVVLILFLIFKNHIKKKYKIKVVPPQFVYNSLKKSNDKILLVNTLSDKMKYKITLNGKNNSRSLSKKEFEDLLKKNKNKIPQDVKTVIIYCASWSCNGAKNYHRELISRNIKVDKVVDYIGSIHEWASYAKIKPNVFTFNSTEDGTKLGVNAVNNIFKNTGHSYYIDNVMEDQFLKQKSIDGKNMFKNNF